MNEMMPYNEHQLQAVAKGIAIIDNEINKKYMLSIVDGCKVVPIDKQTAIKLRRQIKLRKVDKVVLAKGEDINQKLTGVYNSLHHFGATLLVYLHGTKKGVELYFGVKGTDGINANEAINILEKSLEGNFPGSKILEVDDTSKIGFLEESIPIGEEFDKHFNKDDDLELFKYIEKEMEINAEKINIIKYELGKKIISDVMEAFGINNRKLNKVVKKFTKALTKIKDKLPPDSV